MNNRGMEEERKRRRKRRRRKGQRLLRRETGAVQSHVELDGPRVSEPGAQAKVHVSAARPHSFPINSGLYSDCVRVSCKRIVCV